MTLPHPLILQLQKQTNPERAEKDKRYHKSSRVHWGIPVPECEKHVRAFVANMPDAKLLHVANELWETDLFDPMMCAGKILGLKRVKPSPALWDTICHFLKRVDGWALEDLLAQSAWKCVLADETRLDELEEWTRHPNFWMRRAALVYTLPFAKRGKNPERMLEWASSYATDSEWFIQKAIGWWLRVLGEHNPERVCAFLQAHWGALKGVARREATRKLSVEWQSIVDPKNWTSAQK